MSDAQSVNSAPVPHGRVVTLSDGWKPKPPLRPVGIPLHSPLQEGGMFSPVQVLLPDGAA